MDLDYIYLVSNGSTDIYDNTLSSFKNDVLFSSKKKITEIAVSEIIFEDVFQSEFIPTDSEIPSIICSKTKSTALELESLLPTEKIYLPIASYTYNGLLESINKCSGFHMYSGRKTLSKKKIYLWYQDVQQQKTFFGAFQSQKKPDLIADGEAYYCYMYQPLSKALRDVNGGADTEPFETVRLMNHDFDVFKINARGIYFQCKNESSEDPTNQFVNLSTLFSPYLNLYCPSIKAQFYEDKTAKILSSLTLHTDRTKIIEIDSNGNHQIGCYYHQIAHPIYHKLLTEDLSTIQIKLLDMNLNQAQLQKGRATIIKLITKTASSATMNDIKVTLSSRPQKMHPGNKPYQFGCELAESISLFGPQWFVAIVNVSIPTRFQLPLPDRDRVISFRYNTEGGLQRKSIIIPATVQSAAEIIDEIQKTILPTQAIFSIDAHTSGIKITAKRTLEILMRGSFAYFMGGTEDYKNRAVVKTRLNTNESLIFQHPPKFSEYLPSSLFLYADFISPTFCGGRNLQLMKIMPAYFTDYINLKTSSHVRSLDFKSLEYHPVNASLLKSLNFEVRTQTGEYAPFSGGGDVLMNLVFTQKPKE